MVSLELKCFISTLLVFVYANQCVSGKASTPLETVLALNCLMLLLLCQAYIHQLRKKSRDIGVLINVLFQLDNTYGNPCESRNKNNSTKIKGILAFAHTITLTAILFPIGVVHGMHWINPCKTTLVGYWLIRKCYSGTEAATFTDTLVDFGSKFGVIMVNHWLWSFSFHASCFASGAIHALAVTAFQQIIQR